MIRPAGKETEIDEALVSTWGWDSQAAALTKLRCCGPELQKQRGALPSPCEITCYPRLILGGFGPIPAGNGSGLKSE